MTRLRRIGSAATRAMRLGRSRAARVCLGACAASAALVLGGGVWAAGLDVVKSADANDRGGFGRALVDHGASLAAIGNCAGCHTAPGGAPFAGGFAVETPFGTVYGSNLTPDPRYGIGAGSAAAFVRAMRQGIGADGRHLYPAFPYDHFTRATDADLAALYAFLSTRTPVAAATPAAQMRFPLGFRPLVAGWNLLFLDRTPWRADPAHDAEWNRGAYLAEALAHCSACHSPRNALGAERRGQPLAGGSAEGWYAPPLNADSPSPVPWSVDAMTRYLRTGLAADHAIAGGPMQGVTASLARASEADVRAIAVWVVDAMGAPTTARTARAEASRARAGRPLAASPHADPPDAVGVRLAEATPAPDATRGRASGAPPAASQLALGAAVYADACASCHDLGRGVASNSALRLPLAVAVHDADPRSLLRIVREGIVPAAGSPGRWMPAYGTALTDAQLEALAAYLRHAAAAAPPWPELARDVRQSRDSRPHADERASR